MRQFKPFTHPRRRLLFFALTAVALQTLLLCLSPVQVPVVLYKLALVTLAAILGIFFDAAVFPFSAPHSYLDEDWRGRAEASVFQNADFPVVPGYRQVFAAACIRRAGIVAAFVIAVSVGL